MLHGNLLGYCYYCGIGPVEEIVRKCREKFTNSYGAFDIFCLCQVLVLGRDRRRRNNG